MAQSQKQLRYVDSIGPGRHVMLPEQWSLLIGSIAALATAAPQLRPTSTCQQKNYMIETESQRQHKLWPERHCFSIKSAESARAAIAASE